MPRLRIRLARVRRAEVSADGRHLVNYSGNTTPFDLPAGWTPSACTRK